MTLLVTLRWVRVDDLVTLFTSFPHPFAPIFVLFHSIQLYNRIQDGNVAVYAPQNHPPVVPRRLLSLPLILSRSLLLTHTHHADNFLFYLHRTIFN